MAGGSVAVAVWMGVAPAFAPRGTPWWVLAVGPAAFVVAAGLLTMAEAGVRSAVPALVLIAALDQGIYGIGGVIAWQDFVTRPEAEALLDTRGLDVPVADGRLARGGFPNLYVLAGYRLLDGYAGLTPARELDYQQANALRVAGVAFVHRDFLDGATIANAEPVGRGWLRLPTRLPRVRLVADVRVSSTPGVDIASIDVAQTALVASPVAVDVGASGEAEITADTPRVIEVRTEASGRSLLVVAESFDEGWRASIDGAVTGVVRVNGDFLGVAVPAGTHAVALVYRPPGLALWGSVSLMALGAALLLGAWAWPRGA